MKRTIAIALLAGTVVLPLAGQTDAVFSSVSGKVETRADGGSWQAANEGQAVDLGTTISTGFDGRALIEIGESSIEVDSLTRLTLEELVREADTVSTSALLDVGSVEADVQSAEGLSNDFEIRSAETTAAVRGTVFQFDGTTLRVSEGRVSIANNATGVGTVVSQNQQSSSSGSAPPTDPDEETERQFEVSSNTNPTSEEEGGGDDDVVERTGGSAPVYIEIEW